MAVDKSRFVLLCQQGLACALVVAIAAPATGLVTLDIVAPPSAGPIGHAGGDAGGAARSVVASAPVRATVSTVPLTGIDAAGLRALRGGSASPAAAGRDGTGVARLTAADPETPVDDLTVLSAPQPVHGLATIGVTWSSTDPVEDQAISISVRTLSDESWSTWKKVPYHEEEGPDPSSSEGAAARPGTDPVYVGDVDDVQVEATIDSGRTPAGMQLSLVDPGTQRTSVVQRPAIDTDDAPQPSATGPAPSADAVLSAGGVTPKPAIYSRRQWGADERMRDKASLHYGEVHGGFVHHTVNANSYTSAQVPALIRGIYAYHTQSRGWSDIGYNFLVDRFGRIWEGRYGGVRRPVVGAHTLGYNDDAFAGSAIGNFDIVRPPAAVVSAFARLFAWKLSLFGVWAGSSRQLITSRYFQAISGHRDAGQTACPGRYLYAQLPTIRSLAAGYQRSWAARERTTGVAGSVTPAIVARSRRTGQAWLIRTRRSGAYYRLTATGAYPRLADRIINAGDWNRDGRGDVITRSGKAGLMYLYRGLAAGRLAAPVQMSPYSFGRIRLLAAVGDMTGDGWPDLLGQAVGGSMRIYPGNGRAGFTRSYVAHSAVPGIAQLGVGLWNGDGAPDTILRGSNGVLALYPGNGPGGLTGAIGIARLSRGYDWLLAVGDLTGDGRFDLIGRWARTGTLYTIPGVPGGVGTARTFKTGMSGFDLAG
jgi:hypothetical protein